MWVEGSIRLSSRLSLSFPSNNSPLTTLLELDGEAQLRTEWDLTLTQTQRSRVRWYGYKRLPLVQRNANRCTATTQDLRRACKAKETAAL